MSTSSHLTLLRALTGEHGTGEEVDFRNIGFLETMWNCRSGSTPNPYVTIDNRRRPSQAAYVNPDTLQPPVPPPRSPILAGTLGLLDNSSSTKRLKTCRSARLSTCLVSWTTLPTHATTSPAPIPSQPKPAARTAPNPLQPGQSTGSSRQWNQPGRSLRETHSEVKKFSTSSGNFYPTKPELPTPPKRRKNSSLPGRNSSKTRESDRTEPTYQSF